MTKQEISFYDKPQTDTLLNAKANAADLATVATSGNYNDLTNKPSLSTVATTGDYDDLIDKPDLSDFVTNKSSSDRSIVIAPQQSGASPEPTGEYNISIGHGAVVVPGSSVCIAMGLYAQVGSSNVSRCYVLGQGGYTKSYSFGVGFGNELGVMEMLDGTTGKIPDARLNRPVPDTSGASAGDVLALDSNKDLAWVAPSGSGISVTDHTTYITLNY